MTKTELIELYDERTNHGGHFFSPGTMRFFDSRIEHVSPFSSEDSNVYFVTSEKNYNETAREFRARSMRTDGSMRTIGKAHESLADAIEAMRDAEGDDDNA